MPLYEQYSEANQAQIQTYIRQIVLAWGAAPSAILPPDLHPSPSDRDWGLEVLEALAHLANMTPQIQAALDPLSFIASSRYESEGGALCAERLNVEDVKGAIRALGGDVLEQTVFEESMVTWLSPEKKREAKNGMADMDLPSWVSMSQMGSPLKPGLPSGQPATVSPMRKRPGAASRIPKQQYGSTAFTKRAVHSEPPPDGTPGPEDLLDILTMKRDRPAATSVLPALPEGTSPPHETRSHTPAVSDRVLRSSSKKRAAPPDSDTNSQPPAPKKQRTETPPTKSPPAPSSRRRLGTASAERSAPAREEDEASSASASPSEGLQDPSSPSLSDLSTATGAYQATPYLGRQPALPTQRRRVLRSRAMRDLRFEIEHADAMAESKRWGARGARLRRRLALLGDEEDDDMVEL